MSSEVSNLIACIVFALLMIPVGSPQDVFGLRVVNKQWLLRYLPAWVFRIKVFISVARLSLLIKTSQKFDPVLDSGSCEPVAHMHVIG